MKKYEIIESWVIKSITEKRIAPGAKLPSESQLCEQFGVSRNAVRQAIGNLIRKGWVQSTRGVGTFCRSAVPDTGLSMNVGFVAFSLSSYVPELIESCDRVLYSKGFNLILNQSECDLGKEREILLSLGNKGVDGILISPVYDGEGKSNADLLSELEAQGIAIVLYDNNFLDRRFSFVAMDDTLGGSIAAEHLWRRGHRDIGLFFQEDYLVKTRRMEGAAAFLDRQNIRVKEEWIVRFRGHGPASGAPAAARRFFASEKRKPTAFICSSDEDALHLVQAAEEAGIAVPDGLSVVGFDNSSIARLGKLALSSIDYPSAAIGEMMTTMLLDKIFRPGLKAVTRTIIAPSLVERSSVRDLRSS